MAYTSITASTQVSDLPDILNGVTTRSMPVNLLTGKPTAATLDTSATAAWAFDLNDNLSIRVPLPARADVSVAPSLVIALMPLTSETGKEVAFEVATDTVTATNTPVADTGAQSVTSADIAMPTTADTLNIVTVTLSTDVFQSATQG